MNTFFEKLGTWIVPAGRVLIALIFLIAGYGKIGGYEATQGYMAAMGVPGSLLPLVIVLELGGGILLVLGLFTRYIALALGGFTILSALLFHNDFSDYTQQLMFLKNLAIAGGFFFLAAHGAGKISLDHKFGWS
jgi:putative oxidoreductase